MKKRISILTFLLLLLTASAAYAAGNDPKIVTGTNNLIADAGKWITGLLAGTAGTMIAYHAWMKKLAGGDANAIAHHNKWMWNTLISGIIGVSAAGIVTVVFSYYQ